MVQVQVILDRFPALQPKQIIVRNLAQYPEQLQSALQSVSKEGFDIVLDAVSGDYFQPSYDAMARGGRHVIFGAANWTPTGNTIYLRHIMTYHDIPWHTLTFYDSQAVAAQSHSCSRSVVTWGQGGVV